MILYFCFSELQSYFCPLYIEHLLHICLSYKFLLMQIKGTECYTDTFVILGYVYRKAKNTKFDWGVLGFFLLYYWLLFLWITG